ncbi:MAG TPA: hypothetical protein VMG99_06160 [Thermoplasmata archaeon]|nr:hypothetical protein [Thermoplasmata archaeon]
MNDLRRRLGLPGLVVTVAAAVGLGIDSGFGVVVGVGLALAGGLGTVGLRLAPDARGRAAAIGPALAALALGAVAAAPSPLAAPIAALGGIGILLWLLDDPDRPSGGPARGRYVILLPGLAAAIAWAGALVLPAGSIDFGFAAVFLVVTFGLVAVLLGRPDLFDREEALA